jgi:hypothetical protein
MPFYSSLSLSILYAPIVPFHLLLNKKKPPPFHLHLILYYVTSFHLAFDDLQLESIGENKIESIPWLGNEEEGISIPILDEIPPTHRIVSNTSFNK